MIVETPVHPELMDNANEMRKGAIKLSKPHFKLKLKRMNEELQRATGAAEKSRAKARRALKRSWTAEDHAKAIQRRIDRLKAQNDA